MNSATPKGLLNLEAQLVEPENLGVPVIIRIRPLSLAVVAFEGALGAGARFAIAQTFPTWQTVSAGTVVLNLLGPLLLGVFL